MFSPKPTVPALPGALQSAPKRGDCASFQAIACSRPPPPRRRTFSATDIPPPLSCLGAHSHSIVPGGFEVMSYTTRFTSGTSFTTRREIVASSS